MTEENTRILKLFYAIIGSSGFVKAGELAGLLQTSERTVKSSMEELKTFACQKGCQIQSVRGKGYRLQVTDAALFEAYKRRLEILFNNVEKIIAKADEISKLVPEANVVYAHGRMPGKEIEEIMQEFVEGKANVLVCTTILESGIDIPNANTIIVENADRMGLAQLYQIRGRVGRSDKQAYAYITYKRDKLLTEVADKRLKAIKEFTEFGSGFKIAMRDLEIRGAGSLLRRNTIRTPRTSRI